MMLVLITYDVNTEDAAGKRRLRQIAKKCVDYGQRVQNSVFECLLDAGQCRSLQAKLLSIMDAEKDSLRFYYLGSQYEKKVEHFGCKSSYSPEVRTQISIKKPVSQRCRLMGIPAFLPQRSKYSTPLPKMHLKICVSLLSLPTRGAWIEITLKAEITYLNSVAPHTGSVD